MDREWKVLRGPLVDGYERYTRIDSCSIGYWVVQMVEDGLIYVVDCTGPIGEEPVCGGPYASYEEARGVAALLGRLVPLDSPLNP